MNHRFKQISEAKRKPAWARFPEVQACDSLSTPLRSELTRGQHSRAHAQRVPLPPHFRTEVTCGGSPLALAQKKVLRFSSGLLYPCPCPPRASSGLRSWARGRANKASTIPHWLAWEAVSISKNIHYFLETV